MKEEPKSWNRNVLPGGEEHQGAFLILIWEVQRSSDNHAAPAQLFRRIFWLF